MAVETVALVEGGVAGRHPLYAWGTMAGQALLETGYRVRDLRWHSRRGMAVETVALIEGGVAGRCRLQAFGIVAG